MSDQTPPPPMPQMPPPPYGQVPPPPYGQVPMVPMGPGPVGKVRGTGICILLCIVTFGIYSLFWFYQVHEELKRHTGRGLGGLVALLLALFVGVVMPYFTSAEVGQAQELAGRQKTVDATTGLWYFPGIFILVGPIVWFVKTNKALNDYWISMGATA